MKTKIIFIGVTVLLIGLVVVTAILSNNKPLDPELINSSVEDIVFEEEKVNIYYFWGNGCPHCKDQFKWFEEIKDEYGEYFNLYGFEIWHNEDNAKLLRDLTNILDENVRGVPFTIIGEKVYSGFSNPMKTSMLNTIKEQATNDFDVYQEFIS